MSRESVAVLIYHRHQLLHFIYYKVCLYRPVPSSEMCSSLSLSHLQYKKNNASAIL
jgi:hypothetical protein